MPVPDPILNPKAWDQLIVAGKTAPGWCVVGDFKRRAVWDERAAKNTRGANLTFLRFPLLTGDITVHLLSGPKWNGQQYGGAGGNWTHLNDWLTFSELFQFDPTKANPQAVQIYHPSLVFIKVSNFVCEDLGNPAQVDIGHYTVRVALKEWAPAAPAITSGPGGTGGTVTSTKANAPAPNSPPGTATDAAVLARQKQAAAQLAIANGPASIPPPIP